MSSSAPKNAKRTFSKDRRLLRPADFERVYKKGRRHFATHMTFFFLRHEHDERGEPPQMRVGFTVKKLMGGAVVRNRMKRRLREAVRLEFMEPQAPVDVVINPKMSLLAADFGQLRAEVAKAFQVIRKSVSPEPGTRTQ